MAPLVLRPCRSARVDWSKLDIDLLEQIAKRLGIEDYVRVQAVCKPWRLGLKERPFQHNPHDQLPWLAIPDYKSSISKFYNLKEDKFHHLYLPELRNCLCVGSSHGWMIVVDKLINVFMFNPLTRSRIQLPPITTFTDDLLLSIRNDKDGITYYAWEGEGDNKLLHPPEFLQALFFKKVILSGNPSFSGEEDYTVMAICGKHNRVAFCRKGDDKWTYAQENYAYFSDLIYWKQQFYALHGSCLVVCDLGGKVLKMRGLVPPVGWNAIMYYLVISEEKLLLVARKLSGPYVDKHKTVEFRVYKLDEEMQSWVQLTDLEDRMLFLGFNFGLCLSVDKYPDCRPNHIYFTDDERAGLGCFMSGSMDILIGGHDMGCYDLKTGKIEPLACLPIHTWTIWPEPFWTTLSLC